MAPIAPIEVLEKPRSLDTTSWDYLSQYGTDDEVIAMMNRENCSAVNLDKIAFRMKDRGFFEKLKSELGGLEEGPIDRKKLAEALLRFDVGSLVTPQVCVGVWLLLAFAVRRLM